VLFLADTFRADNLAHLGGAPELAPELERLAQRGLAFTNARAPSTWTLPSQASMLSGLYPEQHGATSLGHALPEEVTTLAEQLARHGYRTCAVTDSAFVSRHYGLDQGFECFQELRTWSLRATLAAAHAFLDADDGRPVFLFVQTYRTHMPYRTGADEDRRALEETVRALKRGHPRQGGDGSIDDATAGARMRALYDEGVRALDADFGAFWREREARARGPLFLAFTSDHGEAFLEHGELGHGGAPWEEKVRIPLFLVGPGLAPARVAHAATLVDLPRTLCRLADVPLAPTFEGRDLVELAREALQPPRPAYTFVRIGPESMVAVLEGPRKLYAVADPARLAAGEFVLSADLELDPDERNVLEPQPWARELAAGHARAIEELARALATPARVELSDEDRAFLDAIGYGGER
jgi:arylsulfatase